MTVYFTSATDRGATTIQAGANDVRIIAIELSETGGNPVCGWMYVGSAGSSSMSGGTTQIPYPAKSGAPACLATARVGSTTAAGTTRMCGAFAITSSTTGLGTTNPQANTAVATWVPMGDLILPPGGIFYVQASCSTTNLWFEEMRLSWSY
jgi:hypothetical protein